MVQELPRLEQRQVGICRGQELKAEKKQQSQDRGALGDYFQLFYLSPPLTYWGPSQELSSQPLIVII
jgi:hypothetical protein